ncbi:hypothetical protein [Yoonia sp. SDW83-1]|uniref:hypothetical protein n=1 Tax=Yoonia sp. SDW83-1 TaxID=3366945 RepID=UPI00398C5CA6
MTRLSVIFFLMTTLLPGTTAAADGTNDVTIQAYLDLEGIEAALEFECRPDEECEFSFGELEIRFSIGQRSTTVRISHGGHDYIFFNDQNSISVELGSNKQHLQIYDRDSDTFIQNGINDPAGYLAVIRNPTSF